MDAARFDPTPLAKDASALITKPGGMLVVGKIFN